MIRGLGDELGVSAWLDLSSKTLESLLFVVVCAQAPWHSFQRDRELKGLRDASVSVESHR